MTAKKATAPAAPTESDEVDESLLTTAPDEWEFETIAEESPTRVVFDTFGDTFVGQYQGMQHVEWVVDGKDDSFDLHNFRGRDGNLYSVNDSYKLHDAMEGVKSGTWVRLTYVKDVPVKKGNPMKDVTVEVRTN